MIIIVLSGLYYHELLRYSHERLSIIQLPGFWLNTGLLFFCLLNFLVYSSFAYGAYNNDYSYFIMFASISNIAIAILYSCLAICFFKVNNQKLNTTP
ncbi:hypothetical protein [Mucilaginibacter pedocola]|uniref:Uncharacterized protein n=1 Tax=Mucilaginibacter pedocola TaxID=1792845 RepID=A0A1S9PKC6_9SPHI|nr:hypothetical protein [Mucilaginibacter pedocola]OOQ61385.1 hypothetical protein BC343_20650 [Mucilaginibacter pedocola]